MRINKLLSNFGYASRKDVSRLIDEERIIINGKLATQGQWVEIQDEVLLDNEKVTMQDRIYIALNKPVGITCTADSDVENNIIDFINYPKYIFPVGRLDKESEGLIILTNDGDFANKILESDNYHEKEYIVKVDKPFNEEFITSMAAGVEILGVTTRCCKVNAISEDTFNIVLTQGLNKQIRRMTKAFGYTVIKLQRVRVSNITLGNLAIGEWQHIEKSNLLK